MSVTVEDLRAELKAYNLKLLTDGDSTVIQRAIDKATIWAKAKVLAVSATFDEGTEINRLIVIKRALYELYSYAENEAVAQDKKEDAMELLRAAYGDGVDAAGYPGESSQKTSIPAGKIISGPKRTNKQWP